MPHPFFSDRDNAAERRIALRQTADMGPDEIVLWKGRPKRGIAFTAADGFLIPFAMVWASIALSATAPAKPNVSNNPMKWVFPIVGFYLVFGRFLLDALYRSRLRYVVTNQRVIIINGLPRGGVTSIDRSALSLTLEERADGRGTIRLTRAEMWEGFFARQPWHACAFRGPHLFRIEDARKVYELLRR